MCTVSFIGTMLAFQYKRLLNYFITSISVLVYNMSIYYVIGRCIVLNSVLKCKVVKLVKVSIKETHEKFLDENVKK